jgi:hypothetical protein
MIEIWEDSKLGNLYHELFQQLAHKATESVRQEDIDMLSVCDWAMFISYCAHTNPSMAEYQPCFERLACVVHLPFEEVACTTSAG